MPSASTLWTVQSFISRVGPLASTRAAPVLFRILRQRVPVVAFVNNHFAGYAPETARQLVTLTG